MSLSCLVPLNRGRTALGLSIKGRHLSSNELNGNSRLPNPLETNTPVRFRAHVPSLSARDTPMVTPLRKAANLNLISNFLLLVRYSEAKAPCQPCTSPHQATLHPILRHIHTLIHNRRILTLILLTHIHTLIHIHIHIL